MYTKKIYFSGGNVNDLKKIFSDVVGVVNVSIGTLAAKNVRSYVDFEPRALKDVAGVEIEFNPKKTDLSTLMDILFGAVNPYSDKNSGVYYVSGEDEPQIELYLNFIANRNREPVVSRACLTINDPNIDKAVRKCFVKVGRLVSYKLG